MMSSRLWTVIFVSASLNACGPQHSEGTFETVEGSTVKQESLQAFSSTIYSFGQSQGCVACHGRTVNPQWMSSDLETAYSFARPKLDVNNPTGSIFATYVANNHCGNPICADPANVPVVQDLLAQWAAVEYAHNGQQTGGTTLPNPPYVTATMAIPANLPLITSGKLAVMRFDLSQLAPQVPALVGAVLEISIQSYNSAMTNYKILNPRLMGNTASVRLTGLHVYVRPVSGSGLGTEDLNQGDLWSAVDRVQAMTAMPSPMPSGPATTIVPLSSTSLAISSRSAADVITIGFADIK